MSSGKPLPWREPASGRDPDDVRRLVGDQPPGPLNARARASNSSACARISLTCLAMSARSSPSTPGSSAVSSTLRAPFRISRAAWLSSLAACFAHSGVSSLRDGAGDEGDAVTAPSALLVTDAPVWPTIRRGADCGALAIRAAGIGVGRGSALDGSPANGSDAVAAGALARAERRSDSARAGPVVDAVA